jgi:nitrate/nitrite transporter NarK
VRDGFVMLPPGARRVVERIDIAGIVLIGVTIMSLVLALTELGQRNVTPNYAIVAGAGALFACALVILVWHEQHTAHPVVDLDLLRRREFASANALVFFFGMAWIGAATLIPLYAQEAYELSVAESGAIMSPRAGAMVVISSLSALVIDRTGFRKPLALGMVGVVGSLLVLSIGLHDVAIAGIEVPDFWWLLIVVASAGAFFGFANPSMNNVGLDLAPDRIAAVTGLRGMFMSLGGTLGISFIVLIASRAENVADGIEEGFTVLSLVLLVSMVFILAVPEMRSGRRQPSIRPNRSPS